MGLFNKGDDDQGSGEGGTLGSPSSDTVEEPAGGTQEGKVVSGGGVADTSVDDGGPTPDDE